MNMFDLMQRNLEVLDTASTGRHKRREPAYITDVPCGFLNITVGFHVHLGNVEVDTCDVYGSPVDFEALPESFRDHAIERCWEHYDEQAFEWEDE
jgi:hypothetical protein